jgi:hypothetical protein
MFESNWTYVTTMTGQYGVQKYFSLENLMK